MTIKINSLGKSYGKKVVLSVVHLENRTGRCPLLCWVSWSRKSTHENIISGMEPATSGEVVVDEQDVSKLKGKARTDFYRHKIGFIFQGFYLQPQLTISENIALMGTFAGMPKAERERRVARLAELLGITEILGRLPSEISGGQAERACVARAVFMEPKIILADEPTNNLDEENARKMLEILKQIQRETSATVIVASHDMVVKEYATQVIKIQGGHATIEGR